MEKVTFEDLEQLYQTLKNNNKPIVTDDNETIPIVSMGEYDAFFDMNFWQLSINSTNYYEISEQQHECKTAHCLYGFLQIQKGVDPLSVVSVAHDKALIYLPPEAEDNLKDLFFQTQSSLDDVLWWLRKIIDNPDKSLPIRDYGDYCFVLSGWAKAFLSPGEWWIKEGLEI